MKKINHSANVILAIATFQLLLISCCNYYRAISIPLKSDIDKAVKIDSLNQANRTLILRNGENAYYMHKAVLSADKRTLNCKLDTLYSYNKLHLTKGINGKMRYHKGYTNDLSVLNEAHIYIQPDTTAGFGNYFLPLDKVKKIEVTEKDKQRTSNSYLLGGLGITAGVLVVAGLIGIALASSMSFTMHF